MSGNILERILQRDTSFHQVAGWWPWVKRFGVRAFKSVTEPEGRMRRVSRYYRHDDVNGELRQVPSVLKCSTTSPITFYLVDSVHR